ncbi:MAG TPA: divergent polysaccharide deacetylase family protein [Candidatus Acidoferrum sp.]|nr:divergent polysaccharide deacetylase family protein [Candidatus Acidoferrum sp.]
MTREVIASAQKITARKSEITIRPQTRPAGSGAPAQVTADNIYISLSDPSQAGTLEDALSDIARRHDLRAVATTSGGVTRFDFVRNGATTHTIHIVTPIPPKPRTPAAVSPGSGRLAIILDDLGYDRASADALLALPFPLTVSVIPHLPLSSEVAEEAYRRGDEVLLHLPMESESQDVKQEDVELHVGMDSQQVESMLAGMLETVPHATGVNNHQGSRATADSALMQELMPALRERGLFFIDSRTTTATVAYDVAESSGVRAASRKVFLDDTETKEAVRAQLNLAARDAGRDGFAIAIGHPHPTTIAALAETVPQLESRGIRIVFASDVVR